MREWGPGTLLANANGDRFWVVEVSGNTIEAGRIGHAWVEGSSAVGPDGNGWRQDALDRPHPLVVIDPEGDEAALIPLLSCGSMESLRDMLRSLVEPEVEEPTGLGAVVECEKGVRCVRTANLEFPWVDAVNPGENSYHWTNFGGLPQKPLRVLSEGVQP